MSRIQKTVVANGRFNMAGLLAKLPLLLSFSILSGSWLSFTFTITIPEVLLHRHETWHFVEQLIIFNLLMGLTVLSLFTAATRSPGHADPSLAPFTFVPDAEDDASHGAARSHQLAVPRHMTQTSKSRSRPPTLSLQRPSTNHSGTLDAASLDGAGSSAVLDSADPDDIPLRFLRNSQWVTSRVAKDRPSPLPLPTHRHKHMMAPIDSASPSEAGDSFTPTISPFPLGLSPFVPNTAAEAGGESDWADDEDDDVESAGRASGDTGGRRMRERQKGYWMDGTDDEDQAGADMSLDDIEVEVAQLLRGHPHADGKPTALMAKSNTGGPRFCRKCESWKPDRCHHCRFCKRCVLKMDHHCVWLATCIGHRNYKPFLLFISYGTLLAIYITIEGGYQTYIFMTDEGQYDTVRPASTETTPPSRNPMQVEYGPLIYMLLTMSAAFFTLTIGGLAAYHWFLVCNNLTTLEQISHTYPSALLPGAPHDPSSPNTAKTPLSSWKPDHLLTRSERRRLTEDARAINVYDLGWKRNIAQTLIGDTPGQRGLRRWMKALWPLAIPRNGDGHEFGYDEEKLARLRRLTEELRLGAKQENGDGCSSSDVEDDA